MVAKLNNEKTEKEGTLINDWLPRTTTAPDKTAHAYLLSPTSFSPPRLWGGTVTTPPLQTPWTEAQWVSTLSEVTQRRDLKPASLPLAHMLLFTLRALCQLRQQSPHNAGGWEPGRLPGRIKVLHRAGAAGEQSLERKCPMQGTLGSLMGNEGKKEYTWISNYRTLLFKSQQQLQSAFHYLKGSG